MIYVRPRSMTYIKKKHSIIDNIDLVSLTVEVCYFIVGFKEVTPGGRRYFSIQVGLSCQVVFSNFTDREQVFPLYFLHFVMPDYDLLLS